MTHCLNCMKVYEGNPEVCPYCGYRHGTPPKAAYHITPGKLLHERYEMGTVIGAGGFGITYHAWDTYQNIPVAIKEYYPVGTAQRADNTLSIRTCEQDKEKDYEKAIESFLNEGRSLMEFNNEPGIVHVHDFFEENNTAYIIMEYLEGNNLSEFLKQHDNYVPEDFALKVMMSLIRALEAIHSKGMIHRDISLDNIFVCKDSIIKLIDFGAAKSTAFASGKSISVVVKPNYAPPEQFNSRGSLGPWSDIYALGATMYRLVTGTMPVEAISRLMGEELVPPVRLKNGVNPVLSDVIMKCMDLNIEKRYATVMDMKRELIMGLYGAYNTDTLRHSETYADIPIELIYKMGLNYNRQNSTAGDGYNRPAAGQNRDMYHNQNMGQSQGTYQNQSMGQSQDVYQNQSVGQNQRRDESPFRLKGSQGTNTNPMPKYSQLSVRLNSSNGNTGNNPMGNSGSATGNNNGSGNKPGGLFERMQSNYKPRPKQSNDVWPVHMKPDKNMQNMEGNMNTQDNDVKLSPEEIREMQEREKKERAIKEAKEKKMRLIQYYSAAIGFIENAKTETELDQAIRLLEKCGDYKDSKQLIDMAQDMRKEYMSQVKNYRKYIEDHKELLEARKRNEEIRKQDREYIGGILAEKSKLLDEISKGDTWGKSPERHMRRIKEIDQEVAMIKAKYKQ